MLAAATDGSKISSRATGQAIAKAKVEILPAPQDLQLTPEDDAIVAKWSPVTGASSYDVHLFNASGTALPLDPQALMVTGETARIDATRADLTPGAAYTVKVTAAAAASPDGPHRSRSCG